MTPTYDPSIAIAAALMRAGDLDAATHAVLAFALDANEDNEAALVASGLNVGDIRDFVLLLPEDPSAIERSCEFARAWVLGRRSAARTPTWEPVISGELTADGIDRITAETMIGLIVGSRSTIRIFSPFVDASGLDVLAISLGAAIRRSVKVWFGYAERGDRYQAVQRFAEALDRDGDGNRAAITRIEQDRPFPHLKLIAVDGERAYIGSANLTWPALTSNAEVGALVDGAPVRALERWFDALLARPPDAEEAGSADVPPRAD